MMYDCYLLRWLLFVSNVTESTNVSFIRYIGSATDENSCDNDGRGGVIGFLSVFLLPPFHLPFSACNHSRTYVCLQMNIK
jgi:hypothetical protein